jgi:hypothetical protein
MSDSNSNTNNSASYYKNNDNANLFREHNLIVKQLDENEERISINTNYSHFQAQQKPILEEPIIDYKNENDFNKSRTRSPSSESVPVAPPQPPIPPLTIQIPQNNISEEREKLINRLKYQEEKLNREHEQEWHHDSSSGSEDLFETDENGVMNNLNKFLDPNTNNNTSTDNMNDSIKQVDPAIFLLNQLQNDQDKPRYFNVNPQIDEKALIKNRDEFGQPLVNLPSLDDPLLSLTHEEYAHLKGIKDPPLNQVYQRNTSNNDDEFKKFNDSIDKILSNEEDDEEIAVITNNPDSTIQNPYQNQLEIKQPPIPRPVRTSTRPTRKRHQTVLHNIKNRPPPPKIVKQLSKSLSITSPRSNENNITIIQHLNVTTSVEDKNSNSRKNDSKSINKTLNETSTDEKEKCKKKCQKYNAKNTKIISQYGRITLASNLKVDQDNILFLKCTTYVNQLRDKYKRISINLNENLKHLYIFGAQDQVKEARNRIENDLRTFIKYEFLIEKEELAKFMQKPEIRKKIFRYLNLLLSGKDYAQTKFKEAKINSHISDQENQVKVPLNDIKFDFCSYDIEKLVNEYVLSIYTNSKENTTLFNKFLIETIRVNLKLKLRDDTSYLIRKNDPKWVNLYNNYYQDIMDYKVEPLTISKDNERKYYKSDDEPAWYLKLTGFKEDLTNFISDFRKNFKV